MGTQSQENLKKKRPLYKGWKATIKLQDQKSLGCLEFPREQVPRFVWGGTQKMSKKKFEGSRGVVFQREKLHYLEVLCSSVFPGNQAKKDQGGLPIEFEKRLIM